ncbi:4Fe-4S binding protein [Hyperthermus butylicus]|uniref:4Fe-4S ferredoxin-type domain-containing protein n=1 Tax=Hyperthermus butylicus (strain DSM 5456 / JCM 9403 / PLM1-5) TaxID=415426 RepID=A2BKV0_HYPBU|nr:4Fe-4S binding protein [Hyperthermus butylicus]ABM80611.1 hypothetical protein Hbut_0757 [Hyperthermus butylicus DSM 5456]
MPRIVRLPGAPPVPGAVDAGSIEEAVEVAVEEASREEEVLIVGRGAWEAYGEAAWRLRMEGGNFYLLEALDADEEKLHRDGASKLFMARLAYLARRRARDAVLEPAGGGKRVSRRTLLRTAVVGSAMDYTEKPIHDQLCGKKPLGDYCSWCLDACDVEGGCAASAALCGVELLHVPGYSRAGLQDMLRLLSITGPGYALIAPRSVLAKLVQELGNSSPGHPVVVVPVSCPYVVGLEELLALRGLGLEPIMVDDGWERELRRCRESRKTYLETVAADYEGITGASLAIVEAGKAVGLVQEEPGLEPLGDALELLGRGLRPLALAVAKRSGVSADLRTGFTGLVIVDQERCTLCGACAKECPTGALKLREEAEGSALLFLHDRCIACGWCREVCPEDAITVKRAINPAIIDSLVSLVAGEELRCIVCGNPVGPTRMVEKVVEKLLASGIDPEKMPTILMCSTCKQKYSLGLIDEAKVDWEALRRFVQRARARTAAG